jgi:hypothetical protein
LLLAGVATLAAAIPEQIAEASTRLSSCNGFYSVGRHPDCAGAEFTVATPTVVSAQLTAGRTFSGELGAYVCDWSINWPGQACKLLKDTWYVGGRALPTARTTRGPISAILPRPVSATTTLSTGHSYQLLVEIQGQQCIFGLDSCDVTVVPAFGGFGGLLLTV